MSTDRNEKITVSQRIRESLQEVVVWQEDLSSTEEMVLPNPPATGSLFGKIQVELDKVLKESEIGLPPSKIKYKKSTHDGKPIILDGLLMEKKDWEVVLETGAKFCIRFFPNRPGSSRIPEGVLFRIALKLFSVCLRPFNVNRQ